MQLCMYDQSAYGVVYPDPCLLFINYTTNTPNGYTPAYSQLYVLVVHTIIHIVLIAMHMGKARFPIITVWATHKCMSSPQTYRQPICIWATHTLIGQPCTFGQTMYLYGTEHTAKKTVKYSIKAVSKLIMDIIILLEHYNIHNVIS